MHTARAWRLAALVHSVHRALLAALLVALLAAAACLPASVAAQNSFTNAAIVKAAKGNKGFVGWCRIFVNQAVLTASGGKTSTNAGSGGYNGAFRRAGGKAVGAKSAVAGDIIQVFPKGVPDTSSNPPYPLHTAIVLKNNGGGNFTVIDANFGGSGPWGGSDGRVREHAFNPYSFAGTRSSVTIWRLGKASGASSEGDPRGNFEKASSPAAGRIRVVGWALDPSAPTTSIAIHAYLGGQAGTRGVAGYALGRASGNRPDVARAFKGAGARHGFNATLSTQRRGRTTVCVYAIDVGPGSNKLLDCKAVTIKAAKGSVAPGMPPPAATTADVAVGPGGQLVIAAVKKSGSLYTRTGQIGQGWNDFYPQGEPDSWSAASVAIGSDGQYRLLAVKKSGSLYYRVGTPGQGWSEFDPVGEAGSWSPTEKPDLAAAPDGQLVLAAVKKSGALYTRNGQIGVGWGDFFKQGEVDSWANAAVTIGSDGQSRLLATKASGDLYYRIGSGASWRDFDRFGIAGSWAPTAQPDVAAGPGGQLILAAVKKTGTLYTRSGLVGVGWRDFQPQGIENSWANATVAIGSDGQARLLAIKKTGDLYYMAASSAESWGAFERFGDPGSWAPTAQPGLAAATGGQLILAAVKKSGSLYTRTGQIGQGWNDFYPQGEPDSWATFPPGG